MESIVVRIITEKESESIKMAFLSKMDKDYTLFYTCYDDTFDNNAEIIDKCLEKNSTDYLFESCDEWINNSIYSSCEDIIEKLKEKILKDNNYELLHPLIDNWLDDTGNFDSIRFVLEERDNSNPIEEMVKRTKIRSRATLFSNYEALASNWDMKNTYEYNGYFKDMVDVLCLNPAKIKNVFLERGIDVTGRWPDKPNRNGKEAVLYTELAEELLNQTCYCQLIFLGMLPLESLYENDFSNYKKVIIPKGNLCGMYCSWNGAGSLLEMKLQRNLVVPVSIPPKTKWDSCRICVDEKRCGNGFCVDEVYGMDTSIWGKEFSLIYKNEKK